MAGAGTRPTPFAHSKQVRKGDRVLCYHSAPERALYAIAEVTRDPYPDPHDRESKMMVADLRAMERLPRQVTLDELRTNPVRAKGEVPEERALDHFAGHRGGVSGDPAHGGHRGDSRASAAVKS